MKNFEHVTVESRADLRHWFKVSCTRSDCIWLVRYRKHGLEKHVTWDEIVEEVLCFGLNDSHPRKLDNDCTMLILSPRRPGSPWSRISKERVEKLIASGRMEPSSLAVIEQAKVDGSWSIYDEIEDLVIPEDLAVSLEANEAASYNFHAFSDSSKKGILWWIKSVKRPNARQKRISETVRLAEQNIEANYP